MLSEATVPQALKASTVNVEEVSRFLDNNNVLSKHHFGFCRDHSTTLTII